MFSTHNLSISIDAREIVSPISVDFPVGQVTAILGHNGSGKSSLAFAFMGHPRYTTTGQMLLDGEDISMLGPDKRYEKGIFLSFQNVPEIPGVRLFEYLKTVYTLYFQRMHPGEKSPSSFVFRRMVEKLLPSVGLDSSFLDRDLYVGFSGGEKRRIEMLQIELLSPQIVILDEIDAGLDIDAIELLRQYIDKWRSMSKTIIIITHNFHLLDSIRADSVVIMKD
jgi:Fe-S cluster assembly ATP-binding protein